MAIILLVLIALGVLIVLFLIGGYNGLVKLHNRTKEAWSDIDVQLRRRYNLIPNLVATVKGYAAHEKEVFEKVTEARTRAMESKAPAEAALAEKGLASALKTLFAVAENYPQLQAAQNFLDLQKQLADTEDKIQAARRFYNGNVRDFNTKQEVFPYNMVAGMFSFKKAEFFEIGEPSERENPQVDF